MSKLLFFSPPHQNIIVWFVITVSFRLNNKFESGIMGCLIFWERHKKLMLKSKGLQSRSRLECKLDQCKITLCRKQYKRKTGRSNCDTFSAKLQWKE